MGNDHCHSSPALLNNKGALDVEFQEGQAAFGIKPEFEKAQVNNVEEEGPQPLMTTFRQINKAYRSRSKNSGSPSPPRKRVITVEQAKVKPALLLQSASTRNFTRQQSPIFRQVNNTNENVDREKHVKQFKHRIMLRKQQEVGAILNQKLTLQPNNSRKANTKIEYFLKSQDDFVEKKRISLDRQKQFQEKEKSQKFTYHPEINIKSKKIVEERKRTREISEKLCMDTTVGTALEAQGLVDSASPIKLKTINLGSSRQQKTRKVLKLRKSPQITMLLSSPSKKSNCQNSERSKNNHLTNKLIREFSAAVKHLDRTGQPHLTYLQFCQVMRLMGFTNKDQENCSFAQANERAQLIQAFGLIQEADNLTLTYSVLSLILALFRIDLASCWSKVCKECWGVNTDKGISSIKIEDNSRRLKSFIREEHMETPAKKKKQYYDYGSGHTPSSNKNGISPASDIPDRLKTEPLQSLLNESIVHRQLTSIMKSASSKKIGTRTQYYRQFNQSQILQIHGRFRSFHICKMNETKGTRDLMSSVDSRRKTGNSTDSKRSLKNTDPMTIKHRERIIQQAIDFDLIRLEDGRIPSTVDLMILQRKVAQRINEEKRMRKEESQMEQCTFAPKVNRQRIPSSSKRYLRLYQMGKEKMREREDRQPEEDFEECSFQPNLNLTRNYRPEIVHHCHQHCHEQPTQDLTFGIPQKKMQPDRLSPNSQQTHQDCRWTFPLNIKKSNPRILQIKVDLGSSQKIINVRRGDDPISLARQFLEQNNLSEMLVDRLAMIIYDGMHRANTIVQPQ